MGEQVSSGKRKEQFQCFDQSISYDHENNKFNKLGDLGIAVSKSAGKFFYTGACRCCPQKPHYMRGGILGLYVVFHMHRPPSPEQPPNWRLKIGPLNRVRSKDEPVNAMREMRGFQDAERRALCQRYSGWSLRGKRGATKEWGGGLSQKEEEISSWSAGATTATTSTLVHSHSASMQPITRVSLREH
jgi:hypothetical protein